MKTGFFLVVNNRGVVRTTKNSPSLGMSEIAIYQTLTLPDALFKRPHLAASVMIPDEAAVAQTIDADVAMNVKDAIRQATGLEVRLEVVSPEPEHSASIAAEQNQTSSAT